MGKFNPANVSEEEPKDKGYPRKWREAVIVDAEESPNSKGNGRYLKLVFQMLSFDIKGKKAYAFLNYEHENARCQWFGQNDLKTICGIAGIGEIDLEEEYTEFIGTRMEIDVEKEPGEYPVINNYRTSKPLTRKPPAQATMDDTPDDDIPF